MTGRLFPLDEIPEIPLLRPPRQSRGAAISDERLAHDYPPEWHRCPACEGTGRAKPHHTVVKCPDCKGMGSAKARVRLEAGHRCVRCGHPYMPKGDAKMLAVEPTPYRWSPCDERCRHGGPIRWADGSYDERAVVDAYVREQFEIPTANIVAEWRILTCHHLDGDKANLAWWNLAALCQVCHLTIQGRVVMERVYPHPHSEWFRPFAAGYYASAYLGEDLTREETEARMDELLALELDPAYG